MRRLRRRASGPTQLILALGAVACLGVDLPLGMFAIKAIHARHESAAFVLLALGGMPWAPILLAWQPGPRVPQLTVLEGGRGRAGGRQGS